MTFFGPERDLDGNARTGQISSLDLEAYVYLKEMLTNTPESKESKYFVEKYKTLLAFVAYMDELTSEVDGPSALSKSAPNQLGVRLSNAQIKSLLEERFRQHLDLTHLKSNMYFSFVPGFSTWNSLLKLYQVGKKGSLKPQSQVKSTEKGDENEDSMIDLYAGMTFAVFISYLTFFPNPFNK